MANIPSDLKYTAEHEWVQVLDATTVRFGITDYAQDALGDIVFVSLPSVGQNVTAGAHCGEVESTKSVSDIFAPVSGKVAARNDAVETAPEVINSDPYASGWLADIIVENAEVAVAELLDAVAYQQITG
ncbi:MAG: glycine cleavage system protein GcvH [Actinobacteria bacterium]|nr:glycine cleavage system protein GcvH [Actinomycetota bacterium]NBY15836.1 glycine cleavage system protein GcvH [Actinomycetota bacterium]